MLWEEGIWGRRWTGGLVKQGLSGLSFAGGGTGAWWGQQAPSCLFQQSGT